MWKVLKIMGIAAIAVLVVIAAVNIYKANNKPLPEAAANRGALIDGMDQADLMGDRYNKVIYPDQGWSAQESQWYYFTSQGSNLLPWEIFLELEATNRQKSDIGKAGQDGVLFRDPALMNQYRYLVQTATDWNPEALPVGFVKDTYGGINDDERTYVGYTCAACHTSQVDVNGTAIRVDGGPAMADMPKFLKGLSSALATTANNPAKLDSFVERVLARKDSQYSSREDVIDDLNRFALRIRMYIAINKPTILDEEGKKTGMVAHYGYARLDAFGRIYNRVIENLTTREEYRTRLNQIKELNSDQIDTILKDTDGLFSARDRDEVVLRTIDALVASNVSKAGAFRKLLKIRDDQFNPPSAPVSYPFLWDIALSDFVQWNGIGDNAGPGPMGRNVGEVIGVFGTLDWHLSDSCGLIDRVLKNCDLETANGKTIHFTSSVDKNGVRQIEDQLASLQSPWWLDDKLKGILPDVDKDKVQKGEKLFNEHCSECHKVIERANPNRRVIAFMDALPEIGTDAMTAANALNYTGAAGFLKDSSITVDGKFKVPFADETPVAALLTKTTLGAVATPDPDLGFFEWAATLYLSMKENPIKSTSKQGSFQQATADNPFADLNAYKGRSLNGIWATGPFLHNGSVPTLYHLLLPADQRPKEFLVGSRELDTEYVGFKWAMDSNSEYNSKGFTFNVDRPANTNVGHEYGIAKCETLPQKDGDLSCSEKRWALVEYMKTL